MIVNMQNAFSEHIKNKAYIPVYYNLLANDLWDVAYSNDTLNIEVKKKVK